MVNLTPLDIQQQRFKTRFRGFDIQEVDVFLDQMADAFESLLKQNENLTEDFRRLQFEIQGYKNREDAFKRALLNSQRVIEQTIREKLPEGFQRAEYLQQHGMVDLVVHRHKMRETLSRILRMLTGAPEYQLPSTALVPATEE